MKIHWCFYPMLVILAVGCAGPRSSGSLGYKIEERSALPDEDPAGLAAELRSCLAGRERGAKLALTVEGVNTACDAVLWNIENAETTGFKKLEVRFRNGRLERLVRCMSPGDVLQTGAPLDVAIVGPGFFQVTLPDGSKGYTRDGAFQLTSQGLLLWGSRYIVTDTGPLPLRAGRIEIGMDGKVTHLSAAGEGKSKFVLVDFPRPEMLDVNEEGLFLETPASGRAEAVELGGKSRPARSLLQGYLEMSNVKMVEEIPSLMRLLRWKRSARELVSAAAAKGSP